MYNKYIACWIIVNLILLNNIVVRQQMIRHIKEMSSVMNHIKQMLTAMVNITNILQSFCFLQKSQIRIYSSKLILYINILKLFYLSHYVSIISKKYTMPLVFVCLPLCDPDSQNMGCKQDSIQSCPIIKPFILTRIWPEHAVKNLKTSTMHQKFYI